jgi:hypothetical protein
MADLKTTPDIVAFYLNQCRQSTAGVLGKVFGANGIPLVPTSPAQLQPIPVYEENFAACLLTFANKRGTTSVKWPLVAESKHLQAYVKRYKDPTDGRVRNEIVVNTQNYCWARFYVTKELMHCVTDEDGYPATNTFELVNDLIESLISGGIVDAKPQTIVDEIA